MNFLLLLSGDTCSGPRGEKALVDFNGGGAPSSGTKWLGGTPLLRVRFAES